MAATTMARSEPTNSRTRGPMGMAPASHERRRPRQGGAEHEGLTAEGVLAPLSQTPACALDGAPPDPKTLAIGFGAGPSPKTRGTEHEAHHRHRSGPRRRRLRLAGRHRPGRLLDRP